MSRTHNIQTHPFLPQQISLQKAGYYKKIGSDRPVMLDTYPKSYEISQIAVVYGY